MRYVHARPCRCCGHTLRYVKGRECVHCARSRYTPRIRKPATPKPVAAHVLLRRASLEAKAVAQGLGERTYNGHACRRGHDGMRYAANGRCVSCEVAREGARGQHWRDPALRKMRKATARHSRRAATNGGPSAKQLDALLAGQLGGCAYCGDGRNLHLDHKMPLARGGLHVLVNLQWLCATCNMRKAATPDDVYRARLGLSATPARLLPPVLYLLRAIKNPPYRRV